MLFILLLYWSMAGTAATAAPNHDSWQRDLVTIQSALGLINTGLESLDTAILSGTAGRTLLEAVSNLLHSIQSADMQVQASQTLDAEDAINLKATTDSLTSNVNITVSDLIHAQPLFKARRSTEPVLQSLLTIKTAATQLANDLVGRLPADLTSIGTQSMSNFLNAVNRGIAVYNGSSTDLGAALPPPTTQPSLGPPVSSVTASSTSSTPISTVFITTTASHSQASTSSTTSAPQSLDTTTGTLPVSPFATSQTSEASTLRSIPYLVLLCCSAFMITRLVC